MNAICFILENGNFRRFRIINLPEGILKSKIMEVKIKNGEEMIDATIEMVDGVMVVSPKVELFEPENGDIVTTKNGMHIFLCKDYIGECNIYAYIGYDSITCSWFKEGEWSAERYATEEEKQKFFEKLKEEGYEWDAEKKEVVKIKWKPSCNEEHYFKPTLDMGQFIAHKTKWFNDATDKVYNKKGWIFKTQKECEAFCYKLNQAIKEIKP